jgi:hypothetical protein
MTHLFEEPLHVGKFERAAEVALATPPDALDREEEMPKVRQHRWSSGHYMREPSILE